MYVAPMRYRLKTCKFFSDVIAWTAMLVMMLNVTVTTAKMMIRTVARVTMTRNDVDNYGVDEAEDDGDDDAEGDDDDNDDY